ncbi:hypothetical protein [Chryseobacterium sp. ZHDP1]|uniref:hypothetical protein n=1 Tax=Chryseobacterium sp. ZHDP1 TaxID=2838877 RepID=UPI001BE0D58A|nr:hypothetical protein [Chryseobacterium sp. ZHDP1]QWA38846.1 hypothetical protein KKI44_01130 [Chryseobacterium sp. ZHDP1]
MENQTHENVNEKKQSEKISSEDFFKELNDLLKKAPDNVVLFVSATEDPEDGKETGTAIFSIQGKTKHIVYGLTSAFRHDPRIKEIGYRSVSVHKMMDSMSNKDPFDLLSGLGGLSGLADLLRK